MNPTKRNYRATFILDNRGKEDSAEAIIENVKQEISAVQGDVTAVENNLGKRRIRPGHRPQVHRRHLRPGIPLSPLPAGGSGPIAQKRLTRLNHNVYRTFVESV